MGQMLFHRAQGQISKISVSAHWGLEKDPWRSFVPMRACVFMKHPDLLFMPYPIRTEPLWDSQQTAIAPPRFLA